MNREYEQQHTMIPKQVVIDQQLHTLKTLRAQGSINHAYYRLRADFLRSSLKQIQKGGNE